MNFKPCLYLVLICHTYCSENGFVLPWWPVLAHKRSCKQKRKAERQSERANKHVIKEKQAKMSTSLNPDELQDKVSR